MFLRVLVMNNAASKFESSTDGKFLNKVWVSNRGQRLDGCSEVRYLLIDSVRMVLFSHQASLKPLGLNDNPISLNTTKC